MQRILHVLNALNVGGTETVIMNLYRRIDRSEFQFDFVVHVPDEGVYEPEIRQLGGRVFRAQKYYVKNYLPYARWWRGFLRDHPEYRVVHCHQGSCAPVCLREANRAGRVSVAHSHGTRNPDRSPRTLAWELSSWPTRHVAQRFLACSEEAGIDRFGSKVVRSSRFHVMKNGIDVKRFEFSPVARAEVRASLGIGESTLVVGHAGRLSPQKNHEKILSVFSCVADRHGNSVLMLVGQGEREQELRSLAGSLGMGDRVIFAGVHPNVEDYYSAMDVFLFPSHWEGLGMVAVEAQASGLSVVASEAVPTLADVGADLFERLSLDEPAEVWARAILSHVGESRDARSADAARRAGYDVADVASWLQDYYARIEETDGN